MEWEHWTNGLDYWTGLLDWTTGLAWTTCTHVYLPTYLEHIVRSLICKKKPVDNNKQQ